MRPTTVLWLFSSVLLLANAAPVQPKSSALAKTKAPPAATVKPAVPAVQPTKATVKPVVQPTQAKIKPTNATVKPTAAVPTNTLSKPAAATGVAKACPFKKPGAKTGAKPPATKAPRGYSFEKRAPGTFTKANAPATITIEVDGKEFKLTKFGTQGNNGATYKVDGQAAFAKTNFKAGSIATEATITKEAGLLIATGSDTNCNNDIQAEWLITKQVEGKQLSKTTAFQATIGKSAECTAIVKKAVALAVTAVTDFHTKTGFNHKDFHPGNILFDENVTKANLIDFGNAFKGDLPDAEQLNHFITLNFLPEKRICLLPPA